MIPLSHLIILGSILFGIGLVGALTRKNILVVFISMELMLNSVNLHLVAFGRGRFHGAGGDALALFVIVLAACEVAVGLGIVMALYRRKGTLDLDELEELKG